MVTTISSEKLDYLFNHLFLPPKLPGEDDSSSTNEGFLIDFVLSCLEQFLAEICPEHCTTIRACIHMMKGMRNSRDTSRNLLEGGIEEALSQLSTDGPFAAFHITAQNAGILVHKMPSSVSCEVFELSPTSDSTMGTKGRLIRQFPAKAIEISLDDFDNPEFQSSLAETLAQMSRQTVPGTKKKSKKAKQQHDEDRETTHPRIVTELLVSILQGCGREISVKGICKNMRDDVVWSNSLLPWRRSPLWILIRVALQLTMDRLAVDGEDLYKPFMVFLMAQVLHMANRRATSPSDVLHTMMTKVSGRLHKLENPFEEMWLFTIQRIVLETSECLAKRWRNICEASEKPLDLEGVADMKMKDNLDLALPATDEFLASIPNRNRETESLDFSPTACVSVFAANDLPSVDGCINEEYLPFHLAMVESWVATHLSQWIKEHVYEESTCSILKQFLEKYHSIASRLYSSCPENASHMLLVTGELWVALDKAAVHAIPMLKQYDPAVPTEVWQALLLASKGDMDRLHRVETYLLERRRVAQQEGNPSVFRAYGEPRSFPVRYFAQSASHQELKRRIERDATAERQAKREEFRRLKEEYRYLMAKSAAEVCREITVYREDGPQTQHDPSCQYHYFLKKASNLQISIHEWPLPDNSLKAQTVVFELDIPQTFAVWRDVTLYLIDSVLKCEPRREYRPERSWALRDYDGLMLYHKSRRHQRIHLVSDIKPQVDTHWEQKPVSDVTESEVCVNNGLGFQYFNDGRNCFLDEYSPSIALSELCTFKLPGRAKALEHFLARSWYKPDGQTSNEVIASQCECPDYMSLGEYKALAVLPYGHRIQWKSVLTQLAMPTIDFNKAETATFLLQMSFQAGPYSPLEVERHTHSRLSDGWFGSQMLQQLTQCVSRVNENWESHTSLCIFTFLTSRVLSLAPDHLSQPLLNLLAQCRDISYGWLIKLVEKAQDTMDDAQRKEFLETALKIALVCVDTFNVDNRFMPKILSDPQAASILIETSIIIYNNTNLKDSESDALRNVMLDRCKHTLHQARPVLITEITDNGNDCLSLAVKRRWPDFTPDSTWSLVPSTCYWFENTSSELKVHVSILTGELLVNGLPLSRLPRKYEQHSDYERLFGALVMEVMPSKLPGMGFSSTRPFKGQVIYFGMQDIPSDQPHRDLLVHIEREGSSLDLVPPRTFNRLLPHSFVHNYIHWYSNDTGTIEFRPISSPWDHSPENWKLCRHGSSWRLSKCKTKSHSVSSNVSIKLGEILLLAPSSALATRLATILSPLEAPLSLHMIYDEDVNQLEIQVPALQLEFFMKLGEAIIRSRQFREMQIDADQTVGTLVGLSSKLVLRSTQDSQSRMVIIPEGQVRYNKTMSENPFEHVDVSVVHGTASRVQAYRIDRLLRRLVANDKLESKLFLAYIHALTSFCLPDPFLKRRGTEEALRILNSAPVRTPSALSEIAHDRLHIISRLAPGRSWYPVHLRVMQVVEWSDQLSFLAQDDRFYKIVQGVLSRCEEIDFLYPKNGVTLEQPKHAEMPLVERAILRTSRQQVSGFGAEDFTTQHDVVYASRDRIPLSDRATRAREMAFRAYHNQQSLFCPVTKRLINNLKTLLSHERIDSTRVPPEKKRINFDLKWFEKPTEYLPSTLCQLHYAFQTDQNWISKFKLMAWIATMAYSTKQDEQVTQALLMLALSPSVSSCPLPAERPYDLSQGHWACVMTLKQLAKKEAIHFGISPEKDKAARPYESGKQSSERRKREYEVRVAQAIDSFQEQLKRQWLCETPTPPRGFIPETYLNISRAMETVRAKWKTWYHNYEFMQYLERLVCRLEEIELEEITLERQSTEPVFKTRGRSQGFISIDDIFCEDPPTRALEPIYVPGNLLRRTSTSTETSEKLTDVLGFLDSKATLDYEHRYLQELRESLLSLGDHVENELDMNRLSTHPFLFKQHLKRCERRVEIIYTALSDAVTSCPKQDREEPTRRLAVIHYVLSDAGFFPRVSPLLFLQQLRNSRWVGLSEGWKKAIVEYGVAITALQQAKRLIRFQDSHVDLLRELENIGHQGWDPHEHPEWLLLECESGIMIRGVQQQIAYHMIEPTDNQNAVMQLNMGEGKSSVIVPIVATALGNGSKLVRVIVAKPQAKQMHQMLVSKLAGLLDRPVYQMPFSRDVQMNPHRAAVIQRLTAECMKEGGVLMVQPEHLLSFQLMELECHLNKHSHVAEKMAEIRHFFDKSSRDIVDESDENFSVKFELIYTLGQQQPIEHSPDRWVVIQEVLGLVEKLCVEAKHEFPQSIEIDDRYGGRFPRIRFLRPDAEEVILDRVADSICETGMTGFPIARQDPTMRKAIRRYITLSKLSREKISAVEKSTFWTETTIGHILLLRGLFAGGILAFALGQKRWRVNYGTDPKRENRTKLAVPFRAKDNPTPRSEFSHPDVVIALTCLSYYYGGLDDEALFDALDLLTRSDNAKQEYRDWVQTAPTLGQSFHHLEGINLRDRIQCKSEVFPHLRYSKGAIDYYLCRLVFAKESREFPHKLSASGWDLGKKKSNPTTGFSGTNDSRYLLPLDVKQLDLPEQKHTNALVLEYLLRPDNGIALMPQDMVGSSLDSRALLQMVTTIGRDIRVILDVGAQVIDLTNLEFAKEWLSRYKDDQNTQAVICFSDLDEIIVVDRTGKVEELQTSPFSDQLDQCLVFLDEAHTRGTDLKLPTDYQALVTLGAGLTKDRLVQACMRMRKLGKGQTVTFCIPREIEQKILQQQGRASSRDVTVSDVLCWVINETCLDLRRVMPLWLNQGLRFCHQQQIWKESYGNAMEWAQRFQEPEAQSLEQRYRPHQSRSNLPLLLDNLESDVSQEFQGRCDEFGLTELRANSLQEEQERELSPEAQEERQVEKPPKVEPQVHAIHPKLRQFVTDGRFPGKCDAFKPAFKALDKTSAATHLDVAEFPSTIWATHDFCATVKAAFGPNNYSDSFQRPVQWILTSNAVEGGICLVIISPYEAQELLPLIEESEHVTLHTYAPRTNLGFQPLDELKLYAVPQRETEIVIPMDLSIQLNLFAGQLYLSSFDEYTAVCDALGLAWGPADDSVTLGPDGFIPPGNSTGTIVNRSGFTKSPVRFLKVLMAKIRQECELIEKTHVGKIVEGIRLLEGDF